MWFRNFDQLITNIQLMNFRTYLEFDNNYKRFFAEIINLFITIYLIYHLFLYCLTNHFSWILTILFMSFFSIYFYTIFIHLLLIQSSPILFLLTSILLNKYILYKYSFKFQILLLIIYLSFLYPLLYLLLRYLTIKQSQSIGLKLEFIRKKIHDQYLPSFLKYHSTKNIFYRIIIILIKFFLLLFLLVFL